MTEGQYFSGFLWAPSKNFWTEIIKEISEKYKVTRTKVYKFSTVQDLENLILRLYRNDHVSMNRIKNVKLKLLKQYQPICLNFQIYVPTPENQGHGIYSIEPNVIKMKNDIRKKYRDNIPGYKRDIIMHISDNSIQTSFVDDIITNAIIHKPESEKN